MSSEQFTDLLIQLAAMLAAGVGLGFVARRLRQPSVVGEMAAGVVIGVTVLGSIAPDVYDWLFDDGDLVLATRTTVVKIGMLLFLYVAGSEVDLSDVKTLGKSSLIIGLVGTVLPIAFGIGLVYTTPMSLWGESIGIGRLPFAAFIGMTLANSANPVLARILLDLGMMKSRIATMMMTATVVDDLVNWTLYAVILGSVATGSDSDSRPLGVALLLVAALFVFVLGGVRWAAPHLVELGRRYLAWPSGYIAIVGIVLLVVSSISEAIGVEAFLGAFLVGVAFGGPAAGVGAGGHKALSQVAIGFFAPLFFVSMALRTDFIDSFDPVLVITVTLFALAAKLVSVMVGVRAAGLPLGREAWAIAWGLNARGATGIILAATGLQTGIINEEVFVALVVMSIVTSILAGPMMVRALGPLAAKMRISDAEEETAPVVAAAARAMELDMTAAERRELERALLYRVVVAIDDPATARPLVQFATDLAAAQQPSEVALVSFKQQSGVEGRALANALDSIADELGELRHLEAYVHERGIAVTSTSQRTDDLAAAIADRTVELGARAIVAGDRRDDPRWIATIDRLITAGPADLYVVVAPLPRSGAVAEGSELVVEAGTGIPGEAAIEVAVRLALTSDRGPTVVGVSPDATAGFSPLLALLDERGRPGRIESAGLDSTEGAAVAADARVIIRPFSAPEGLEPIERARPDAERFACPVVLVAPETDRTSRAPVATERPVSGAGAATR